MSRLAMRVIIGKVSKYIPLTGFYEYDTKLVFDTFSRELAQKIAECLDKANRTLDSSFHTKFVIDSLEVDLFIKKE
ncbi:MAG: hypothetical protein ACK4F9_06980 [Brevinematia bacterium]